MSLSESVRTDPRRSSGQLSESRRFIGTLLANLPGAVYRCRNDREWTMEFLTEQIAEITGYPREDLIENRRRSYASLIHPHDRARVWQRIQAGIAREEGRFEIEYRIVTAEGDERWVWEQGRAIRSSTDDPIALEGFILDVTERKSIRDELRSRELELLQAQKAEAVAELATACAHDLNNAVMVMQSGVLLLEEDPPREERDELLQDLKDATESVSSLTKDLLSVARPGGSALGTVRTRDLLERTVQLATLIVHHRIAIHPSVPEDVPDVVADHRRLEQALLNLVINARDAMPEGGALEIRATGEAGSIDPALDSPEEWVVISVEDTGIGMEPAVVDRIFEPFFTTKEHGTGLGLPTSRRLVEEMGGRLVVDSRPGIGSAFHVFLRRAR